LSEQSESKDYMSYFVYILRNDGNKLYIGQARDIGLRLERHNAGKGSSFTKQNKSFKLVYSEECIDLQSAMKREKQLKGWTRAKKEALIASDLDLLKKL
jgi:putative endonuclease